MPMPSNLFALCRRNHHDRVRRIPLEARVQQELEELFDRQEQQFLDGRDDEISFTESSWKPDRDQLLTITDREIAQPLVRTLTENPTIFEELDTQNLDDSEIKAIFSHSSRRENRILIQQFKSSQCLGPRRWNLVLGKDRFTRLSQPGLILASSLVAVLDDTVFKFQSFHNLRMIFNLQHHSQEATDQEVKAFISHPSLHINSHDEFQSSMTEPPRKLVKSIMKSGILEKYKPDEIIHEAQKIGLKFEVREGRIIVPNSKSGIKDLLRFLDNSIFKGPLSEEMYETNSKRPRKRS